MPKGMGYGAGERHHSDKPGTGMRTKKAKSKLKKKAKKGSVAKKVGNQPGMGGIASDMAREMGW